MNSDETKDVKRMKDPLNAVDFRNAEVRRYMKIVDELSEWRSDDKSMVFGSSYWKVENHTDEIVPIPIVVKEPAPIGVQFGRDFDEQSR